MEPVDDHSAVSFPGFTYSKYFSVGQPLSKWDAIMGGDMATGKISRLPREIREQLNQRLDAGEPGNRLVAWLNELSAVRGLLAAEFEGAAINEQNLTNWKQGGFREWRMQQEVRAFTQQPAGLAVVTPEQLATIVTARYLAAVREWQQSPMPAERRWRHMRVILQDVMKLQRQGQRAARLELDWERLRFAVERFEAGQQTEARRVMIGFLAAAKEWPELGTALAAAPRLLQQRKAEREGKESELESIKVDQGEKKLKNEGRGTGQLIAHRHLRAGSLAPARPALAGFRPGLIPFVAFPGNKSLLRGEEVTWGGFGFKKVLPSRQRRARERREIGPNGSQSRLIKVRFFYQSGRDRGERGEDGA